MDTIIKDTYVLKMKVFSYDTDSYMESEEEIEFVSKDSMMGFYNTFISLPVPSGKMPFFGDFKSMKDFNELYETISGCSFFLQTGGISTDVKAFHKTIKEIEIKL